MPSQIKAFIVALCAVIGLWGGVHWVRPPAIQLGGDIQKEIVLLELRKPDILLIGNSYLNAAVNPDTLTRLSGRSCALLKRGGSASACWYLMVKNVLRPARHTPQAVVVYFRDNELTLPAFQTTGRTRATRLDPLSTPDEKLLERLAYQQNKGRALAALERFWPMVAQRERIKVEIEQEWQRLVLSLFQNTDDRSVGKILNRVFVDFRMNKELLGQRQLAEESAAVASRDMFDFSEQEPRSFLSEIIRLVREKGCKLILVRHRCRYHAQGRPDSANLIEYTRRLRSYLTARDVAWVDFSKDKRIKLEHFSHGDHFNGELLNFDSMLVSRLLPHLPPR